MARYQLKPNGEIVLTLSGIEARGLAICAKEGYAQLSPANIALGNKIEVTAALRAVMTVHEAVNDVNRKPPS